MPLPCPGPAQISLEDLQNEFGGSNPIELGEYYRNGGRVPSNNTNVPTSGTIGLSNFFCAVNQIVRYVTSTSTNIDASSYFSDVSGAWSSNVPKVLIINGGVIVGSTNPGSPALTIPGFGGTFKLINYGTILGAGGAPNGGTGGTAIVMGAPGIIDNPGTIYGGGGGGGQGGQGGQGIYSNTTQTQGCGGKPGCPAGYYETGTWQGRCCQSYSCGWNTCCSQNLQGRYCQQDVITSGGAGGAGGRGFGYDGNGTSGSAGSAGGTNAGTGGTGGSGGGYGNSGATGGTGSNGNYTAGSAGSGGGLAGYYIQGNGNVTWLNTGTRAGRVG
jgi:hypothetical protein